ncbi:MAG: zf-HC2 domain-containing protein [Candidatus Omnitrophica bacterium]|nr:zf-HC2 domain-containing protein [Candidatus Omnitrophota bacterium]
MENKENNIDRLIKEHLEGEMSKSETLPLYQDCPSELELSDYLENRLSREKEDSLLEHIARCPHCLSLLELAQREAAKEKAQDKPTPEMIRRAKNIMQKRPNPPATDKEGRAGKTIFNYKWQALAFMSFILSFAFTRYFLQFLVLAVIFSIKWIFDAGSTRTLIMIYEAWRKKDKGTAQRIIRDFQDKIEQRK